MRTVELSVPGDPVCCRALGAAVILAPEFGGVATITGPTRAQIAFPDGDPEAEALFRSAAARAFRGSLVAEGWHVGEQWSLDLFRVPHEFRPGGLAE